MRCAPGQGPVPLEGSAGLFPGAGSPETMFAVCLLEHCPMQLGGPHPGGCAQPFPAESQDTGSCTFQGTSPRAFCCPQLDLGPGGQCGASQQDREPG